MSPLPQVRIQTDPVYRRRRLVAGMLACALVLGIIASSWWAWSTWRGERSDVAATAPPSSGTPVATPSGQDATPPPTPTAGTPTPATPTPDASTTPGQGARDLITITFAGDVHFEGRVGTNLTRASSNTPALATVLSAADFTMVNLETAITKRGTAIAGKPFTFRAPPTALPFLKDLGVDTVSMANNHAADYGAVGLQDTLAAKASGVLPIVGIGADLHEALTPVTVDIGGVRTAILANSDITEETSALFAAGPSKAGIVATNKSTAALVDAVKAARADHDLVIVFPHWGTEATTCPNDQQRRNAKALSAAGADIIVGGHAHRVQGTGWLGDTFVGYGLGNFIWYNNREASGDTGVLTVTVDPNRLGGGAGGRGGSPVVAQQWTPMLIQDDGIPVVAKASAPRLTAAKRAADACSDLSSSAP